MIELRCPACKQRIKLDESSTGKRVACVGCGKEFLVPELSRLVNRDRAPTAGWSGSAAAPSALPSRTRPASATRTTRGPASTSTAAPSGGETTLLERARRHRTAVVGGMIAVAITAAAFVIYQALPDSREDDKRSAATGGNNDDGSARSRRVANTDGTSTGTVPDRSSSSHTGNAAGGVSLSGAERGTKDDPTVDGGSARPARSGGSSNSTKAPTGSTSGGQTKPPANGERPAGARPVTPFVSSAHYVSRSGLLLRESAELDDWLAVEYESDIPAGTRIAAPRPFEAVFDVGRKMYRVRLVGGTSARLLDAPQEPDSESPALKTSNDVPFGFELRQGRLIVQGDRSSDVPGAVLSLAAGGELWRVEMLAGNTLFGVEIRPREPDRFEQDFGVSTFTGGLYVVKGSVRIVALGNSGVKDSGDFGEAPKSEAAENSRIVAGTSWLSLSPDDRLANEAGGGTGKEPDSESPAPSARLPEPQFRPLPHWLDLDTTSIGPKINLEADLFEELFNRQQAFQTAIQPLLASRDERAVLLAVDCLALLEMRVPLIKVLSETEESAVRLAAISGLRRQMPASAEDRQQFQKDLREAFTDDHAEAVYHLLWGYPADEVRQNRFTCFQLLDWLTHESVVVRELAWAEMTRHATAKYGYEPDSPKLARRKAVRLWQLHVLRTGTILGDETR